MKLFGTKKDSTHTREAARWKKPVIIVAVILASFGLMAIGAKAFYDRAKASPPPVTNNAEDNNYDLDAVRDLPDEITDISDDEPEPVTEPANDAEPEPTELMPKTLSSYREGMYTFAILGRDKVSGSTDTIMVAAFDAVNNKMNVISIPRDTFVNVSWTTKKANTLYSSGYATGGKEGGVSALKTGLKELCGFEIGYYVIVDLDAFVKLIDAVGGVTFDVPQDMDYDDPGQNLHIHLKKGEQHLNGTDAMGVVRYRKGYRAGDIKRIEVQQDFMASVVSEVFSKLSEDQMLTLADIFLNDIETDLDLESLIYFANKVRNMTGEDFTFNTLPGNYGDSFKVKGSSVSYVTVYIDDWLEMVNEYLNPTAEEITRSSVSIPYKSGGKIYVTSGTNRISSSWGNG